MFWPCETTTSTCRNFATISSGVYRFFGIAVLLHVKRHSSGRTTSKGEDQTHRVLADRAAEQRREYVHVLVPEAFASIFASKGPQKGLGTMPTHGGGPEA